MIKTGLFADQEHRESQGLLRVCEQNAAIETDPSAAEAASVALDGCQNIECQLQKRDFC
jgi:hypothetical protein